MQTDRETDRQTDRQTDGQTDRRTHIHLKMALLAEVCVPETEEGSDAAAEAALELYVLPVREHILQ